MTISCDPDRPESVQAQEVPQQPVDCTDRISDMAIENWWIVATSDGKPIYTVCSETQPSTVQTSGQKAIGPFWGRHSVYRSLCDMADKWLSNHGIDSKLKAQREEWHRIWEGLYQHGRCHTDAPLQPQDSTYQLFPDLSPEEEKVLRASIAEMGVLTPIVKDEQGKIVEGHQRKRLTLALGKPCPEVVRHFESEAEKFRFALVSNRARRSQLNQRQKRHAIACYLKGDPQISNNWLAELIGVSDTTVIEVRKELEATSQIGKFKTLRGKDGKKRPATTKAGRSKPKGKKATKPIVTEPSEEDQGEPATVLPFSDPPMPDPAVTTVEETKIVVECVAKLGGWERAMAIIQDCYRAWQKSQTP